MTEKLGQAKQEIQQRARKALTAIGIQVSTLARTEIQKSPSRIDTGLLRNSITYALDGEGAATSSYSADKASRYSGKYIFSHRWIRLADAFSSLLILSRLDTASRKSA